MSFQIDNMLTKVEKLDVWTMHVLPYPVTNNDYIHGTTFAALGL